MNFFRENRFGDGGWKMFDEFMWVTISDSTKDALPVRATPTATDSRAIPPAKRPIGGSARHVLPVFRSTFAGEFEVHQPLMSNGIQRGNFGPVRRDVALQDLDLGFR